MRVEKIWLMGTDHDLAELVQDWRLKEHAPTPAEVQRLLAAAERNLADSRVASISDETRFDAAWTVDVHDRKTWRVMLPSAITSTSTAVLQSTLAVSSMVVFSPARKRLTDSAIAPTPAWTSLARLAGKNQHTHQAAACSRSSEASASCSAVSATSRLSVG